LGEKPAYSTNASGSVRIVGHSENPRAPEGSVLVSPSRQQMENALLAPELD